MQHKFMKLNFYNLFIFVFILISGNTYAQDAGDHIFDPAVLHEVRFEFDQSDYWEMLITNYENTPEGGVVPYLMGKVTIDGAPVDSVGVRFKGFTSYPTDSDKKPIKIDFNEFVKGKKYDGLKKLNLNNGTGDPSMQRDVLCYDLLRGLGVKASRTSYSKVYFNGVYWGLYQNIEQIDKVFLKHNFSNGKGNLFKNKGWSHFEWNGPNPTSYHPPFELKTNEEGDDWSGFVNLMDVLNNASDDNFPVAIEEIFNVDLFLKTLAVDVATNNWDSYLEHGRNWYIYEDTTSGVFNWIPWDYNFALGGGTFDDEEGGGEDCFVSAYFRGYTDGTTTVNFFNASFALGNPTYLWEFGDNTTSDDENPIHNYDAAGTYNVCLTVTEAVDCTDKICFVIDTNVDQECASITNGSSPHPVNEVFLQVVEWLPDCCELWGEDCESLYNEISGQDTGFGAVDFSINQQENEGVLINRLLSVPEFNNRYYTYFCHLMNDQMTEQRMFNLIDSNRVLITEAVENDPHYLYTFEEFNTDVGTTTDSTGIKAILSKRIDSLQVELNTLITCPSFVSSVPWQDVVINEFMASTDSTATIKDSAGEIEDWVELYNNTDEIINLTGVYLSDDANELQKWQFPAGTMIPADGYLIIWADKDENQSGLHSNFKLKKTGEQLVLSNSTGNIIDSLSFGQQPVNIASARRPNGTGDFVFQSATLGFNNEEVLGVFELDKKLNISLYPNPTTDYLVVDVQNETVSKYQVNIYTVTGQLLLHERKNMPSFELDVRQLQDGFYFLNITDDRGNSRGEKFIISR